MTRTPIDLPIPSADVLEAVRSQVPLIQSITNAVTVELVANVTIALGATPAMVDIVGEAGPFASVASAVHINIGTPHAEQRQAMVEAADAAVASATPWVLDPVAVGMLPVRTALAQDLLSRRPSIIRGNASEIIALAGVGAGGRGVDSEDAVEDAEAAARALARATGGAVAVSGPVDLIVDADRTARIAGGHILLTRITGGGCALGAVMAACVAVHPEPFEAAAAASDIYGQAAERAAVVAAGPGDFRTRLLDSLASIPAAQLRAQEAAA
ncbi:hydroxyethylthiazole kinase [Demequina globuliformis]|uniref:hydroxyethylthiazole kinase n=1 Tax=Demequina globuliformis TaxID=676202 RepID=UPI000781715D|nr:hydroxyethylthiazole kinase [Demequina globuliformis]